MDPAETPKPILSAEEARKVQQKAVTNLVRKIASGRTPTAAELRIINSFVEREGSGVNAALQSEWVGSYKELGAIVGLHANSFPRILRDHKNDPLLKGAKRQNGQHSVAAWRAFLAAHPEIKCKSGTLADARGSAEEGKPSKGDLEWEKLYQQCRRIKFDNEVHEKMFTANEVFASQLRELAAEQQSLLRQKLENEYPAACPGLEPEQRAELKRIGRDLVDDISKRMARLVDAWGGSPGTVRPTKA